MLNYSHSYSKGFLFSVESNYSSQLDYETSTSMTSVGYVKIKYSSYFSQEKCKKNPVWF